MDPVQNQPSFNNVIVIYPPSNTFTTATDSPAALRGPVQRVPEERQTYTHRQQNPIQDTNQCMPLCKLIGKTRYPPELYKNKPPKMIWCFRKLYTTAAFTESKRPDVAWTPFQQKNQMLLAHQLELFERDAKNDSCTLHDRRIGKGNLVVTILLKETLAFALDPENPEPITFEIARLPKLNWYQKIIIRHQHKQFQKKKESKIK